MKRFLSLLLTLICLQSFSQGTKISPMLKTFEEELRVEMLELTNWGQNQKLYSVSDSEAKEPAVVIDESRADYIELPKIESNKSLQIDYRMYYKRVHINEDKSVQTFNKLYLQVRSADDLVDLRAHTISATGKISKEFNEKDMKLTEEDGKKFLILAIDGAEKGGEVEYFYITRRSIQIVGSVNVQGNTLIRKYTYTLRVPEHIEFLFKGYNGCPDVKDENKGDYNYYRINVKNVPVLNKETFQNYDSELMRSEFVLAYFKSTGKERQYTYSDFSKDEYRLIMNDQKETLKEIKKLSKKLKLAEITDNETKIRTIENWIKSNIIYSEDVYYSKMSDLIKNKYTGELGLLKLYAHMFEYNEIKYQIWVTCDRDSKEFDEDFESYNFLEDYYFYFPKVKKFIDFKNIAWRLGIPPSAILGQKAMQIKVVDLGNGEMSSKYTIGTAKTPGCSITDNVLKLDITLDASMNSSTIKYHSEQSGYENYLKGIFSLVTDEEKRKEILEEQIKRASKDAVVTKIKTKYTDINDQETVEKPIIVDAQMEVSKIIESAGEKTILKIGELIGEQSELYSDKPRQSNIVNFYPHMYTRLIVVHVPDGYTVKGLDKFVIKNVFQNPDGETTDSIGFESNYLLDGNVLTITCTEYYEFLDWPKEKYEQYRTVINSAADFNKLSIIFDPKK